jgi:hypothetical protein
MRIGLENNHQERTEVGLRAKPGRLRFKSGNFLTTTGGYLNLIINHCEAMSIQQKKASNASARTRR